MKKNLLEEKVKVEIINRSRQLNEDAAPLWGKMNAAEMLHHCAKALQVTLQQPQSGKPSTLKQSIARYLVLLFVPRLPKGARAPHLLDVKRNNITGLSFENELAQFANSMELFYRFEDKILTTHPYFGQMSRKQWGVLTWMHIDHHLRQFGV